MRARLAEFIDVVKALWDSWEDRRASRSTRRPACSPIPIACIRSTTRASFFTVRGPLNVPRPPQGTAALDHARDMPAGRRSTARFVAKRADIILTESTHRAKHVRARLACAGRTARDVRVLTNLRCISGRNRSSSRASKPRRRDVAGFRLLHRHTNTTRRPLAEPARPTASTCLTDDIDLLIEVTIPLAQRAGLVRTDYTGTTLREHFGLHRPRSQFIPEGAA